MEFKDLNIISPILKALDRERYVNPTPIQQQAIPPILLKRDILGCAQTGTGKTAAFAVPTLQLLYFHKQRAMEIRRIRSLILTPTRELAIQIYENFSAYGFYTNLRVAVIYGGVSQIPQEQALKRGVDILVATPGRLIDLLNQHLVDLQHVEILTLDEADRMLDMGFIHDVKKIIAKTPVKRQTLLFSATMPPDIVNLSKSILTDPVKITITPKKPTVEAIEQQVYYVDRQNKRKLLMDILKNPSISSALVFTRTKHGADRIARELNRGDIKAEAIHGDKSQHSRQLALQHFKGKTTRVLVATDLAARGLDIDELSHVINFDLPDVPETYVHRIGRTGRAGRGGIAISFCDVEERKALSDIEKLCGKSIHRVPTPPYPVAEAVDTQKTKQVSHTLPIRGNRSKATSDKNQRHSHISHI